MSGRLLTRFKRNKLTLNWRCDWSTVRSDVSARYSTVALSAGIQSRVGKLRTRAAPATRPANPFSQPEVSIKLYKCSHVTFYII